MTPPSAPSAQPQSPALSQAQPDPVAALIARSRTRFDEGARELALGHLERARTEFDAALDLLLDSPYGARTDPRLRAHFDRLVDQISAFEISALAEGDGFTERRADPAPIDDLLALPASDRPDLPPGLKDAVASDLERTSHDIPIPLNPKVLAYVDLFQGRLQTWVTEGLGRATRYLPMIQQVFRAEGLPLDLAYLPLVESAFRPSALSRAKAKGVWQFMRGTALEQGLKHDWYVDERANPEKATVAAARYLKTLLRIFDGDWHLALASYNGGPGLVQRAMKRYGQTDFWGLSEKKRALPRETREYVPMLLAAIIVARNPAQYGIAVTPSAAVAADRVRLPGPVDLRLVAEWTGVSIDAIQELNPELRRWTTPVRYPDYELSVPAGTGQLLGERLQGADPADLASLQWHVVKKGETLTAIANKLRVRRANLADANYLSLKAAVRPGQRLIVPRAPTAILAARADRPAPLAESRPLPTRTADVAVAPASVDGERLTRTVYRVRSGDTLASIARGFRTSVAAIKRWNRLTGNLIKAGDRLTIFRRAGVR